MARRAGTSTSGDVCRLNSGDLLSESDGFEDADGQWEVAWSADRVASETQLLRSDGLLGQTTLRSAITAPVIRAASML